MQVLRSIHLSSADIQALVVTRTVLLEVVSRRPFVVEATAGRIWLTRERELRDEVLAVGQRLCLPPDCKVVLSGLPAGTARFTRETDNPAPASMDDPA
ncbi:MAG TPA: DUF2917 domain-containing protein [Burkholderiaceae bacterium]|nr:DUF2917 domain-containing protein [Burkholderiaceae bacterium]